MVLCRLIPGKKRNALRLRNSYDPFAEMDLRMSSLFDNFFGGTENQLSEFMPRTDVVEDEKHIEVSCELAGLDEKDISITLTDETLTIEGEKKIENEESEKGYHHVERRFGSFKRVIPLASEIDSENVKAEFSKGVLKVTMAKLAEEKSVTKQIPIS